MPPVSYRDWPEGPQDYSRDPRDEGTSPGSRTHHHFDHPTDMYRDGFDPNYRRDRFVDRNTYHDSHHGSVYNYYHEYDDYNGHYREWDHVEYRPEIPQYAQRPRLSPGYSGESHSSLQPRSQNDPYGHRRNLDSHPYDQFVSTFYEFQPRFPGGRERTRYGDSSNDSCSRKVCEKSSYEDKRDRRDMTPLPEKKSTRQSDCAMTANVSRSSEAAVKDSPKNKPQEKLKHKPKHLDAYKREQFRATKQIFAAWFDHHLIQYASYAGLANPVAIDLSYLPWDIHIAHMQDAKAQSK